MAPAVDLQQGGQLDAPADRPPAPTPSSEDYARLVWAYVRTRVAPLDPDQAERVAGVPQLLRALPVDPWLSRYLEYAERSLAGRPISGGSRTGWLSRQRRDYARGRLPAGRAELLERLDGFTWTPDADRWEQAFAPVAAFAAEHGRIPARGDNPVLAAWLATQRLALRNGRLSDKRAAALATLPGWSESLSTPRAREQWERRYGELARFLAEGDGCFPDPRSEDPAEAELGQWVDRQRACRQGRDLSAARAARLEELPKWRWSSREAKFDWRICELRHSLDKEPFSTAHPLYGWVRTQRRRHRAGRLTDEQVDDLRSLGLLS